MQATFRLDGIEGLTADLQQYGSDVLARVSDADQVTATRVQERARTNAPRDKGDLVEAIQVQGSGLTWFVGLVDEDLPSRGGENTAHRNPSVYGVWYEFGFKTRNIGTHAFMGPARDAEEEPHLNRLIEAMNGAVPT
jgi:hypothetical protein